MSKIDHYSRPPGYRCQSRPRGTGNIHHCRPRLVKSVRRPAIVNQLDPFLPPCPITSRYNVIPAGYNGRLHADPSHEILVDQATARMRSLLTRRGLRKTRSFDESARKFLRRGKSKPCPGAIQLYRRRSPRMTRPCRGNRRLSEVTMAMSLLARWIEPIHVGLDSKLTARNTRKFRSYSSQE